MDFSQPFGGLVAGPVGAVLSTLLRTSTPLTGRQIHRIVGEGHALSSAQQAINTLIRLGLVDVTRAGRANLHVINRDHSWVEPLRVLLDPMATVRSVVREAVDDNVQAVVLFGSVARGEATARSDIDLAVIAPESWDGRVDLQDAVARRLGNACDVLVFTETEFEMSREPVVADIRRDGVALYGDKPLERREARS